VLAESVSQLVQGEITNEEFDEREELCQSEDPAIRAIWTFCSCLYSSATPFPYKLAGRRAPDDHVRVVLQRCILFLESDNEYLRDSMPFEKKPNFILRHGAILAICVLLLPLLIRTGDWRLCASVILVLLLCYFIVIQILILVRASTASSDFSAREWRKVAMEETWPFSSAAGVAGVGPENIRRVERR
jgi:hypothetical protein